MLRFLQVIIVIILIELCSAANIPMPIRRGKRPPERHDAWYRLPSNTVPETYDITLWTNIHRGVKGFNGTVEIGLRTLQDTRNITIHKRYTNIHQVDLWRKNSSHLSPEIIDNIVYDIGTEKLTILTKNILPNNTKYLLKITYNGTLRTDEEGFYESYYFDEKYQMQ